MHEVFKRETDAAIQECSHILIADIRKKMATIEAQFNVTAQQARDKQFNIPKNLQKAKGLSTKKGGPAKTSKKSK